MLVCGRNVAKEILLGNKKIKKCYLQEGFKEENILSLICKISKSSVSFTK